LYELRCIDAVISAGRRAVVRISVFAKYAILLLDSRQLIAGHARVPLGGTAASSAGNGGMSKHDKS
jgi:hypothetical protein